MWRQIESSDALKHYTRSGENLIEEAVTGAMQQTESACEAEVTACESGWVQLVGN